MPNVQKIHPMDELKNGLNRSLKLCPRDPRYITLIIPFIAIVVICLL